MLNDKFNYHKIIFTLDTYKTPEEKVSFLYGVKVDINKVIQCFSRKKLQELRKYTVRNVFAIDGCDELTEFLQEVVSYYNSPKYGDRYISDEILQRHLREEVAKYKNLLKMIDSDLEFWISKRDQQSEVEQTKGENNMEDLNQNEDLNLELNETDNSTSIRELKDKQKIMWKGSKEDLIHFFDQLFGQRLLTIKSYDEIFSIASHYFVDENGEPIIVEKSASAKMNLNGPKIPKGYQRYLSSIEKLKSLDD